MDAESFGKLFFSLLVIEYLKHHTHRELADEFECIPGTVLRWAAGTAYPMLGVQKLVTKYINDIRQEEGW